MEFEDRVKLWALKALRGIKRTALFFKGEAVEQEVKPWGTVDAQTREEKSLAKVQERDPLLGWNNTAEEWEDAIEAEFPPERAIYCLKWDNPWRQLCMRIVLHKYTYALYIFLTIVNVVLIAASDPVNPGSPRNQALDKCDLTLTVLFTVELAVQVCARGVIMHERSYLRSAWRWLDLAVVALGYLGLSPAVGNFGSIRTVRLFRALRDLLPTLKTLMVAMAEAAPIMGHLGIQLVFFYLVFGIAGMQLFEGSLQNRCVDSLTGDLIAADGDADAYPDHVCNPTGAGRPCDSGSYCIKYVHPVLGFSNPGWGYISFDTIENSFLTIFQCLTQSQWSDYMFWVGHTINQFVPYIYFILMQLLGVYIVLNMALAAIMNKYEELESLERKANHGSFGAQLVVLAFRGRSVLDNMRAVVVIREVLGHVGGAVGGALLSAASCGRRKQASEWAGSLSKRWQGSAARLAVLRSFARQGYRWFVYLAYLGNYIQLAAWHVDLSPRMASLHRALYIFFTAFFGTATVVELAALGPRRFASLRWNWLELAATGWSVGELLAGAERPFANSIRVLALLRPLADIDPTFRIIVQNAGRAVASLAAFAPIFVVVLLVLSLLGVQLFAGNCVFSATCDWSRLPAVGEEARPYNFDSLFSAYQVVLQTMTADSWNDLLFDGMRAVGGGAGVFFVLVIIIGLYVMLNMWQTIVILNTCANLDVALQSKTVDPSGHGGLEAREESDGGWTDGADSRGPSRAPSRQASSVGDAAAKYEPGPPAPAGEPALDLASVVAPAPRRPHHGGGKVAPAPAPEPQPAPVPLRAAMLHPPPPPPRRSRILGSAPPSLPSESDRTSSGGGEQVLTPPGDDDFRRLSLLLGMGPPEALEDVGRRISAAILSDAELPPPSPPVENANGHGRSPRGGERSPRGAARTLSPPPSRAARQPAGVGMRSLSPPAGPPRRPPSFGPRSPPSSGPSPLLRRALSGTTPPRKPSPQAQPRPQLQPPSDDRAAARSPASSVVSVAFRPAAPDAPDAELARAAAQILAPAPSGASGAGAARPSRWRAAATAAQVVAVQQRPFRQRVALAIRRSAALSWMADAWDWWHEEFLPKLEPFLAEDSKSCFLWDKDHPARARASRIIHHKYFVGLVQVAIIVNAGLLAFEATYPERHYVAVDRFNVGFALFFAAEMGLKVVAKGFVLGRRSYLRNPLNLLDAAVVVTSFASVAADVGLLPENKTLRAIRAARSIMLFRLMMRLRTMRALLTMARRGGPILLRVIVINWLIFSVYAIIGVRLLGGKLWQCSDRAVLDRALCTGFYVDAAGVRRPLVWQRVFYWQSLDTYLLAMLHLFEVVSLEQWSMYMHWAQAAVGVDRAIQTNASWHYAWFYHAFLYSGLYTGMAMIIGVLVFFFQKSRQSDEEEATEETGLLSREQRECRDVILAGMGRRLKARPRPPKGALRLLCWNIVRHPLFDPAINAAIFANVVVLAAQRNPRPASTDAALDKVNVFFASLFLGEMLLKLLGLGPRLYGADPWNWLDGAATAAGILGLAVAALNSHIGPNFMRGLRLLRVIRILRLARLFKGVRLIFVTVLDCLPALCSIGLLLLLVIYVYGIIGVWQFRYVMLEGASTIREDLNFQSFPRGLVSLFRMTTGENWDTIMWDHMRQPESGCTPGVPYQDCGTTMAAPVFFVSFFFLTYFLGNNLFVAVVRDSFERIASRDEHMIREAELKRFEEAWERLDPRATGYISVPPSPGRPSARRTVPGGLGRADAAAVAGHDEPAAAQVAAGQGRPEPRGGGAGADLPRARPRAQGRAGGERAGALLRRARGARAARVPAAGGRPPAAHPRPAGADGGAAEPRPEGAPPRRQGAPREVPGRLRGGLGGGVAAGGDGPAAPLRGGLGRGRPPLGPRPARARGARAGVPARDEDAGGEGHVRGGAPRGLLGERHPAAAPARGGARGGGGARPRGLRRADRRPRGRGGRAAVRGARGGARGAGARGRGGRGGRPDEHLGHRGRHPGGGRGGRRGRADGGGGGARGGAAAAAGGGAAGRKGRQPGRQPARQP